MREVTVTLPDGSSRAVPSGTPVRDVAAAISPRLAKAALAAVVDDRLVDLDLPPDRRRTGPHRHAGEPRGAAAAPAQHGAPAGGGGDQPVSRASSAASVRPPTKGSSTTSSCRGRSCPRTSRRSRRRCASSRSRICPTSGRCGRATRQAFLRRTRRAAQGAADRGEDRRPVRGVLLHHQGPRDVRRLLRRPARAVDGKLKAFKLLSTSNAYWKGDARNQPMQRVYGTAFVSDKDLQEHLTRIEEAKKRDHRKIGRDQKLFIFHQWAPGRDVLAGQGHHALQHARRLHARRALPGRLRRGQDAAHLQQGALGDVRATGSTTARTCSSSKAATRRDRRSRR